MNGGKTYLLSHPHSLQKIPTYPSADLPGLNRIWFFFFLIMKVTHAYDFKNPNIQRGV